MSMLTAREMIDIAREQKKKSNELAFSVSGVVTVINDGTKPVSTNIRYSREEHERYKRLSKRVGVGLSTIVRALLTKACDDMEVV